MIKFRAWDKNQQIMRGVRGLFWTKNNLVAHCSPADNKFDEFFTTILNDGEYHLMQSTGLKDLKGVEIFEGDVLRVYEIDDIRGESEYTSPVIWKDYGWLVYDTDTDIPLCLLDRDSDWVDKDVEIEVLGNIHANPELLI